MRRRPDSGCRELDTKERMMADGPGDDHLDEVTQTVEAASKLAETPSRMALRARRRRAGLGGTKCGPKVSPLF